MSEKRLLHTGYLKKTPLHIMLKRSKEEVEKLKSMEYGFKRG